MLECILVSDTLSGIRGAELEDNILASCTENETDCFRRVAFDCMPLLSGGTDDEEGKAPVIKKGPGLDHTSKFGIEACLKATESAVTNDNIDKIALAWKQYVESKNALLRALDENIKALR